MSTSTEKYLQHKVKYPCITVEPVVLVFFISYSMIVTLRAEYITLRIADGLDGTKGSRSAVLGPDDTLCRHLSNQSQEALYAETQSRASYWLLLLNLFQVVPSLVSAPLIGSWSDLGGRKRALVIPIIGYLMGSIVWIIVTYTDGKLWYLLLAEFCLGLTGDFSAVLAVCNAYLADITTERERTFRLILVGITIEVGTGASQILVGYWVVQQGFGVPFWFVVATMLASLVYITVLLKETRGKSGGLENLELFNNRLLDDIYGMFMRYSSKQRRQMMFFMIVLGVHMTILYTAFLLILLYVLSPPLCWTPITVGYYVASALLLGSAGTLLGGKIFNMCVNDLGVVQLGALSFAASLTLVAFSRSTTILFIAGICGSFRFLVSPAVRSRLSKLVDEEEQGAMFSLASSIESIGHLIGPLIFNLMYGITTGIYQGFTFLVMASFYVPICFMTGYYQLTSYWISKHKTVSTSDGERMATP
ncbi:proton-coupled folate transporter-like isoform X1 [Acanthaster planci]|uniref:Proton-coupled folate transporter n=1 Tax=Acanthaster planci TaxID=133434 RepID=A0A8B7YQJ0_ACAPL|nr:proton-coupled folate transporter-like isoform X1 [Acanthaster planci]